MPKLYWVTGYNLREGKAEEYQKFLASAAFKKVVADVEKQTGMKYVETYSSVIPNSMQADDYDCYDFWEMPNRAAIDKVWGPAVAKLAEMTYKFTEPRPSKSMLLRKASDTRIIWEPKK
jgi:hypothetical protein